MSAILFFYIVDSAWMKSFMMPFPAWVRWTAAAIALATFPLLAWTHRALGDYWTSNLRIREHHTLVTVGPYRWVRHPMYSLLLVFCFAVSVVSGSGLFLLLSAAQVFVAHARIEKEEEMLLAHFGDEYRAYTLHTGRLLPRFGQVLLNIKPFSE
jgi:protein-S-isoprenylcysteine O-methyltransferase Ste14